MSEEQPEPEPEQEDVGEEPDAASEDEVAETELVAEEEPTFWEGQPCAARRVSIVVAADPRFAAYWASSLVGQRRDAVEVSFGGETFYLDDEPFGDVLSLGWEKVTVGRGMSSHGHRSIAAEPDSVRERDSLAEQGEPDDAAAEEDGGGDEEGGDEEGGEG